jgi:hypothetical protein
VTVTLYELAVKTFVPMPKPLSAQLDKGAVHARVNGGTDLFYVRDWRTFSFPCPCQVDVPIDALGICLYCGPQLPTLHLARHLR